MGCGARVYEKRGLVVVLRGTRATSTIARAIFQVNQRSGGSMGTPRLGDAQRLGNSGNVRTDKIQSAIIFVDPATSLDILFDVHVEDIVTIPTSHCTSQSALGQRCIHYGRGALGMGDLLLFFRLQSPRNVIVKRTFSEASKTTPRTTRTQNDPPLQPTRREASHLTH